MIVLIVYLSEERLLDRSDGQADSNSREVLRKLSDHLLSRSNIIARFGNLGNCFGVLTMCAYRYTRSGLDECFFFLRANATHSQQEEIAHDT